MLTGKSQFWAEPGRNRNGWGQVLSSPCGTSQDLILPFLDPAVSAPPSRRGISQDLTPFVCLPVRSSRNDDCGPLGGPAASWPAGAFILDLLSYCYGGKRIFPGGLTGWRACARLLGTEGGGRGGRPGSGRLGDIELDRIC